MHTTSYTHCLVCSSDKARSLPPKQQQLPTLADHFETEGVRSSMFASQWFITLFLYRIPHTAVFRMLDVLFLEVPRREKNKEREPSER